MPLVLVGADPHSRGGDEPLAVELEELAGQVVRVQQSLRGSATCSTATSPICSLGDNWLRQVETASSC